MNRGQIVKTEKGVAYWKDVCFSKAVLWKDRQISINKQVADNFPDNLYWIVFVDKGKGQLWKAKFEDIKRVWQLRKVGQEEQYYIPIDAFTIKRLIYKN